MSTATKIHYKVAQGQVQQVKTILNPSLFDKIKVYYAKIVVIGTLAIAIINDLTPLLNFLPGNDKSYVTALFAAIAGGVAFLKKEQGLVDSL